MPITGPVRPGIHRASLTVFAGRPSLRNQMDFREIDDLGATSGVFVWNALGMYPVIPGVGGLALGTPMFHKATLQLGNGAALHIISRGDGPYIQKVILNGKPYDKSWLPLNALGPKENRLEFELAPEPNKLWAAQPADLPPSYDVKH